MTRTNVSKLRRLERSFVTETQGPPESPPRVPSAVVGSINHHDLDAHRYPEPPFGGPTVDGESIGHQEGTAQNKVVFACDSEPLSFFFPGGFAPCTQHARRKRPGSRAGRNCRQRVRGRGQREARFLKRARSCRATAAAAET